MEKQNVLIIDDDYKENNNVESNDLEKDNKEEIGLFDTIYDEMRQTMLEFENEEENKENEEENKQDDENENKENEDKNSFIIEEIEEKIGHISHLKIIKNDKIFIVRDYNICEIRSFKFELIKRLNIKSKEILNFDILFNDIGEDKRENKSEDKSENNKSEDKSENKNIKENNNDNHENEFFYLILLDIDCNIILYNSKEDKSEILFNLETDNLNIDKDIKEQKFFSFGYPYYIRMTKKYIAVSSDYGCILVQYSQN
jgi:hypothetical protein